MTTMVTSALRRVLLGTALIAAAIAVVPAQQRPAPARTAADEAVRPLRLIFLGHDREHHPSGKLLPLIAAPLARRGIQFTHVSTPEEVLNAACDENCSFNRGAACANAASERRGTTAASSGAK